MEVRIELTKYNYQGQALESGVLVFDRVSETVTVPSGRKIKIVRDMSCTYTYKIQKRSVKATGGIDGLIEFLEEIGEAGSPFNRSVVPLFLGL
jgi:hypothetical protein